VTNTRGHVNIASLGRFGDSSMTEQCVLYGRPPGDEASMGAAERVPQGLGRRALTARDARFMQTLLLGPLVWTAGRWSIRGACMRAPPLCNRAHESS
jgi:hypothetical protein